MSFLSYLINGISLGSVYAIIALGYTMVYGIAKMLNFAHGDVIMVGGYIALISTTSFGCPPLLGVLVAVVCCTVLGVVRQLSAAESGAADLWRQHGILPFGGSGSRADAGWRQADHQR